MARQRLRSASEPSGSEELPLKDRLYSTWYRLKYGKLATDNCVGEVEAIVVQATSPLVLGWQFRSSVEIGRSPVWVLGKCYHGSTSLGTVAERTKAYGIVKHGGV